MPCRARACCAMPCQACSCRAMPMPCRAMPKQCCVMPCRAMLCHAVLCHAIPFIMAQHSRPGTDMFLCWECESDAGSNKRPTHCVLAANSPCHCSTTVAPHAEAGDEESESIMDEEDLDRMAGVAPAAANREPTPETQLRPEPAAAAGGGKKRKSPTPPPAAAAAAAAPAAGAAETGAKRPRTGAPAAAAPAAASAAPAGLTSVPAAGGGVITAEELRQLLRSKGRILVSLCVLHGASGRAWPMLAWHGGSWQLLRMRATAWHGCGKACA